MIDVGAVTGSLVIMLADALGVPVGDHGSTVMTAAGQVVAIDTSSRFAVVWQIDGGEVSGSFGTPSRDATLVYQVDWHGRMRAEADGLATRGRDVMTGVATAGGHEHVLAGDGWRGNLRTMQTAGGPEGEGVDESGRPVWVVRDRFEVQVVAT